MANYRLQVLLFVVVSVQDTLSRRITRKDVNNMKHVASGDDIHTSSYSMEYSLTEQKSCDCGTSSGGVSLNPVCSAEVTDHSDRCTSRDLAQSACKAVEKEAAEQFNGKALVAYAAKKSQCSATGHLWCCKAMNKSKVAPYLRATRENFDIFKDWVLQVQSHVDEVMLQLQLKVDEGNKSGRASDANMKAAGTLLSQCKDIASSFNDALQDCAVRGKDDIETGCAQYRQWTIVSRKYANKLLAIIDQLIKLVNYMLYGSELQGVMDYLTTARKELFTGRFFTRTLGGVARKVFGGFWNHRMKIVVGFSIAAHAVPLAQILTSTVTLTTVSQGYDVVFSTLLRTIFWRVVCPAIHNNLVMGFVVQWVVQNIILSDMLLTLVDMFLLPATGTFESLRWLQSKVRGVDYKTMTMTFANGLKDLHKKHGLISWAIWTMLWSLVSHIWNILGRLVCTGGTHISDTVTLVENGAEAATRHASKGVWSLTSWMSRNVKELLGGSTVAHEEAKKLLSNMEMLESEMPKLSNYLVHAEKGLHQLHAAYVPTMQVANSVVTGLLDQLSLQSAFGAVTVKWVTERIFEYMKSRERSVDVDHLIKTIDAEEAALAEMEGYNNKEAPTDAMCDMQCLLDMKRLEGAETATRRAMAEVKGVAVSDVPRVDVPPSGAIESPLWIRARAT